MRTVRPSIEQCIDTHLDVCSVVINLLGIKGSGPVHLSSTLTAAGISLGTLSALAVARLLINLNLVDLGSKLRQNFVGLLMVLKLGSNEVREVAEWFGGIENLWAVRCGSEIRPAC